MLCSIVRAGLPGSLSEFQVTSNGKFQVTSNGTGPAGSSAAAPAATTAAAPRPGPSGGAEPPSRREPSILSLRVGSLTSQAIIIDTPGQPQRGTGQGPESLISMLCHGVNRARRRRRV
jgi:hypothetical protein